MSFPLDQPAASPDDGYVTRVLSVTRTSSAGGVLVGATGTLAPGDKLGPYVVEQTLGSGGFSTVYRASDTEGGRQVAIKLLHPELVIAPEMVLRFLREVQFSNRVKSPHIVQIREAGTIGNAQPYLVMELLVGRTLGDCIRANGPLTLESLLGYMEPVCEALAAAHEAGIVHRDIKPGNIQVLSESDRPVIKLLDFGIAKLLRPEPGEEGLTQLGTRLGTRTAMAPEQIRGETVDARTDIYALGVLLFHSLTGRPPYDATDASLLEHMHLTSPPPPLRTKLPEAPPALERVILTCLEKDPAKRFQSVPELLEALRAALPQQAHQAQMRKVIAAGLYLEVETAGDADPAESEVEISEFLDGAEGLLRGCGFELALSAGNCLFGIRPLEGLTQSALEDLTSQLNGLVSPQAPFSLAILMHVAPVEASDQGISLNDNALLDVETWRPQAVQGPIRFTPAAAEALADASHLAS